MSEKTRYKLPVPDFRYLDVLDLDDEDTDVGCSRVGSLPLPDISGYTRSVAKKRCRHNDSTTPVDLFAFHLHSPNRCSGSLDDSQTHNFFAPLPDDRALSADLTEETPFYDGNDGQPPSKTPQRIMSRKAREAEMKRPPTRQPRCPGTPARTPATHRLPRCYVAAATFTQPRTSVMSLAMFDILETLGEGSSGTVYKVRQKKDGSLFALKVSKRAQSASNSPFWNQKGLDADPFSVDDLSPSTAQPRMCSPLVSCGLSNSSESGVSSSPPSVDARTSPVVADSFLQQFRSTGSLPSGPQNSVEEDDDDDFVLGIVPGPFSLGDEDDAAPMHAGAGPPSPLAMPLFPRGLRRVREVEQQSLMGNHPNIVAIKTAWEENGHTHILSELCGESLSARIRRLVDPLPEPLVVKFAHDLLSALAHIHAHRVIHLDIKPENILLSLDASSVKIADFGQAYQIGSASTPEEGDGRYMAPELLHDVYTEAADMFSLGVTLYQLCTPGLVLPANGERWQALRRGDIDFRTWPYSTQLQQLVAALMAPDRTARPTARSLLNDWFLYFPGVSV